MSENLRRHTKTCASGDCPCFVEGKRSIRTELAETLNELMVAMQRVRALIDREGRNDE